MVGTWAGVLDGGADTVAAFTHRGIGQAHGVEVILIGDNAAVIDLHVDQIRVDAIDGRAEGFGERHVKWSECTIMPLTTGCDGRRCTWSQAGLLPSLAVQPKARSEGLQSHA